MYMMADEKQAFQVDELVQIIKDNKIKDGKITAVHPPKILKSKYDNTQFYQLTLAEKQETEFTYDVLWNSGEISKSLFHYDHIQSPLDVQDSTFERKFRLEAMKITPKIEEKTKAAMALLEEAIGIADQYGIPFNSPLAITDNSYVPATTRLKFSDLSTDELERLCGLYIDHHTGWQTSYC